MITISHRGSLRVAGVSLLLFASAACSSDSETDTTPAVTSDSVVASSRPADDNGLDSVPLPTATDDREAIIEYVGNVAEAAGIEFDEQCVTNLIAQMSDADAALVADSARRGVEDGDPDLSAEGEAIGDQVEQCEIPPTTSTG